MIKNIKESYINKSLALECESVSDETDLLSLSNEILSSNIKLISILPSMLKVIWSCLEKNDIEIFVRLYEYEYENISDFIKYISNVYKMGATGVQLFIKKDKLISLIPDFLAIKANLFYNKKLSICFELNDFSINSWSDIFLNLRKLEPSSILLNYKKERDDDFPGLIYGFLDTFDDNFKGEVYFSIGNSSLRVEQVWRLVEKLKPDLLDRIKFFITK